ncbi:MAG TPA: tRNA uridine-5-carboxymethylaminomethyl(34) synthesis enzyme MnmG [Gemmatimonadaceae bacterium]|nr:tRNA uridine-5-carboxymethylaminomethyl(34) synthesis enzyme MnmG [Gemmatimonadaceae bacterium]
MSSSLEASFDVIVIGAGHAGTEAAVAAARRGARVAIVTSALDTIGHMSCNPAIGGVAKGTVVKEVDALGGIMARATDLACLQFRMLNRSKGPAVWAPRAQCDRGLYRRAVRRLLEEHKSLRTVQGTVARLLLADDSTVLGVETLEGRRFGARAVVVTTGTFLRGRIHIGTQTKVAGGRAGESASTHLAEQLEQIGLRVSRFKTGTPPRIDGRTVDYSALQRQDSEIEQFNYSWSHFWREPRRQGETTRHPEQLPCWITHTSEETKRVITENLEKSAMYGGAIGSRGPRYCPSVEDKIVKFPQAERHQLFLEPEGHDTTELYVNGLSTSLPVDVQLDMLKSVPGLEQVEMTRAGYAIEYDYYVPTQLDESLAVRSARGLFFAGQINGTTGYEEAAGQGLVAGANAAAMALELPPLILGREQSFIGVLVDDLVTRGVDEPYRLFTSRSEFRLTVRQDNALGRLAAVARAAGLLSSAELAVADVRLEHEARLVDIARQTSISPEAADPILVAVGETPLPHAVRIAEIAKRPDVSLAALIEAAGIRVENVDAALTAELELKYAGYFERERAQAERLRRLRDFALPRDMPYLELRSLSTEARQKLDALQPATLAQAASVPGVSASDIQNLVIAVERRRRTHSASDV